MSSTRALYDVSKIHGVNYFASAVGEVNVVEKMKEVDAVIGGEGNGVSKQVLKNSDFTATIPMSNNMNSLNVSSAVSAIVFERLRQVLN